MDQDRPDAKAIPPGITLLRTLEGHGRPVLGLTWTPSGDRIMSASWDHTIRLWAPRSGEARRVFEGHDGPVTSAVATPDRRFVVSTSLDTTIRLWNYATAEETYALGDHGAPVRALALTAGGQRFVSASTAGDLRVWDLISGECRGVLRGHEGAVNGLALTPDGQFAVSAGSDHVLRVWHLQSRRGAIHTLRGHTAPVLGVAVTADGNTAISASADRTLRIWDLLTGQGTRTLEGHTGEVASVSIDPTGQWVASHGLDDQINLWALSSGQRLPPLPALGPADVGASIAFHPGDAILATVGPDARRDVSTWHIDWPALIAGRKDTSARYRNAKVVLVGETGVGKSGLGMVLAGEPFSATESTHGRRVWTFDGQEPDPDADRTETRETLLWDLAGQPGYRLVHQLNIDQAVLALVLIDARSETDPLVPPNTGPGPLIRPAPLSPSRNTLSAPAATWAASPSQGP